MSDYIPCVEVAKLVREALKTAFGNFKFSVTSEHHTTINIRWTDGPSRDEVDAIVNQFKGSTWNSYEDLSESVVSTHPHTGKQVHYGSNHVFAERKFSPEFTRKLIAQLVEKFGTDANEITLYEHKDDTVSANVPYESRLDVNHREMINQALIKLQREQSAIVAKQPTIKGVLTFERAVRDGQDGFYIGGDTWPKQSQIKALGGAWQRDQKRYWLVATEIPAELQALAIPVEEAKVIASEKIAGRLVKTADLMQSHIDHARREMTQNPTHKRNREYDQRLKEANKLEALQDKIRALAVAHLDGSILALASGLTSKTLIAHLIYNKTMPAADGWGNQTRKAIVGAGIPNETAYSEVRAYLIGLGNPDAGKESDADKLAKQEREVSLMPIPGFFPTPAAIVQKMIAAADIQPGMSVLEPSAGKGDIADAVPNDAQLDVIELASRMRDLLILKGYTLAGSDFMELENGKLYDRVVMNPPFERGQDVDHVRRAYAYLRPGGRLVAIMSNHAFFAIDSKSVEFRRWLEDRDGTSESLPDGAFMDSDRPTGVKTQMIIIDKPSQAKPAAILHLEQQRDRAEARIKKAVAVLNKPGEIPGPMVTGGSNYPASLSKALDRENNKRAAAFNVHQQSSADLNRAINLLHGVKAGEIHPNGQRRADAPSRLRAEAFALIRSEFTKTLIKAGDEVAVYGTQNTIKIVRVNDKSLTAESGSKWNFSEVRPLVDGKPMTDKAFSLAFVRWENKQTAQIDPDNDYLWQYDDSYPDFDTIVHKYTLPTQTDAPAPTQAVEFTTDHLVMISNRIGIMNVDESAMKILRGLEGRYKITIEAIGA